MTLRPYGMCLLMLLLLQSLSPAAWADALRDPTIPPDTRQAPGSAQAGNVGGIDSTGFAVLAKEGVHYLIQGTRLYAPGDYLGKARLVRVTETEIWLLEEGSVRKMAVFGGIDRRPAQAVSKPVVPAK